MTSLKYKRPTMRRVYVKVSSEFDSTGYMHPKSITWSDGRTFDIQKVQDFHPAPLHSDRPLDCYNVIISGQEKLLYFEHIDHLFSGRTGRWFVEIVV